MFYDLDNDYEEAVGEIPLHSQPISDPDDEHYGLRPAMGVTAAFAISFVGWAILALIWYGVS
jgi:hypothetical protein